MKKIVISTFVIAALMFFGTKVNSSERLSNSSHGIATPYIQYQVNIHPNWVILHNQCPMWVLITDETTATIIGIPQLYQHDMNTYTFYEIGPVSGVRIAHLINSPEDLPGDACYNVQVWDSKTGTFNNDMTYIFNLYSSVRNIIRQDNSTVTQ